MKDPTVAVRTSDVLNTDSGLLYPSCLERAKALAPLIQAEAEEAERAATLTAPVYEALNEHGLFRMLVPRNLGGGGLGLPEGLEVIEEIGCADGSAGWTFAANSLATCVASGFLSSSATEKMFRGPKRGPSGGMAAPVGAGTRVHGGYQVTGHFRFGSGIGHADWVWAGFTVVEDGLPVIGDGETGNASGLPTLGTDHAVRQLGRHRPAGYG